MPKFLNFTKLSWSVGTKLKEVNVILSDSLFGIHRIKQLHTGKSVSQGMKTPLGSLDSPRLKPRCVWCNSLKYTPQK